MDRVLNPILSNRVIAFINGAEHKGQFIFSTHNVLHLDLKNYMKEQIYFITKDKDSLTSELYSLANFPEVRYESTKVYEFYMKGILGGTAFELPKHPKKAMSEEMLLEKLEKSRQAASVGNYKPADSVVVDISEKYSL
jgi:hypothetical protein